LLLRHAAAVRIYHALRVRGSVKKATMGKMRRGRAGAYRARKLKQAAGYRNLEEAPDQLDIRPTHVS